ncbi:MAG TPA: class E sortase [Acidimicrobiales bacterium]
MTDTQASTATMIQDQATESPAAPGAPAPDPQAPGTTYDRSWGAEDDAPPTGGGRTVTIPDIPYRRLTGFALVGIAGLLVLFLLYLAAFTPLTQSRNQQRLANTLKGEPLTVYKLVNGHVPPEGSAVAILQIPRIGLDKVVVTGTSAADLMNGPGLMPGSSLPGSTGNSVIAGRRVTFGAPFGALGSLRPGDKIHVVDGAGSFTYKVTRVHEVGIGQKDVVLPTVDSRITLVTSNSSLVTSGRLVVQGSLVGHAVVVPDNTVSVPSYDLGLSGDPAAGGLAALWSFLTIAFLVAAAFAVWKIRRPWLIYLFAAPVVLMCGLFACESVARALPATF